MSLSGFKLPSLTQLIQLVKHLEAFNVKELLKIKNIICHQSFCACFDIVIKIVTTN